MDEDLALALQLQSELFEEQAATIGVSTCPDNTNSKGNEPSSLVDPFWELTDPNPDIRALFLQFNERFFWGTLAGIEVRWSPRMTLCAGLCCYEGRGGLCSVRLSVPLLKLRPRKDLVETLLHEMIHAYLFVTDNNKDHDGHGPEFHKHMYRINNEAGTNISVYHNFHDEVDAYRQHWWRCDGPCRSRKPYFGYVKRSMNRAPSKNDTWWEEHQRTCGGTYTKIKEPEDYGKKKGKKDKDDDAKNNKVKGKSSVKSMDIRIFGGEGKILSKTSSGDQSMNVVSKPFSETDKSKPTATISRLEDSISNNKFIISNEQSKPLENGNITSLPGAKTPEKKNRPNNKPVSQGGVAKFIDTKKKITILPDFSDSDDDDEILSSIPLDNMSSSFVNSSSVIEKKVDSTVTELSPHDCKRIADEVENVRVEKEPNEVVKGSTGSEAESVRAMLRKVWGEKRFGNKNKIQPLTDFGRAKFMSEPSDNSDNKLGGIQSSIVKKPVKRLSNDTEFDFTRTLKKQKNVGNGTSVLGVSVNQYAGTGLEDRNKRPENMNAASQKELGEDNCQQLTSNTMSAQNSANIMSTDNQTSLKTSLCPVCNKQVLLSSINDHLDLCLTMQSL